LGIALLLVGSVGCSKKKNNFFSRSYHETTTHFNGYFNAREGVRASVESFEDSRPTNWEEPLPIIIFPAEEEASSLYPAMDKSIEKTSKVIDRHSMLISKKQHNDWIDDSYLLMGISYFYKRDFPKAEETFKYVSKQFKKEPIRYEAELWLARIAIEKENYIRATSILEKLEETKSNFPKGMNQAFYEVYTHLHMKKVEYPLAIDRLQQAIAVTKKKDRRARQTFLLAQLYDRTGQSQKSVRRFGDVVRMNPDYEMKFYAQINQALAFDSRSDSEEIRSKLNKMLRDEKYIEFRDQIYYALAEVEFAERKTQDGIQMLINSTESSVNNDRQKGKSFLRLADIYFEERNYPVASEFYDSTITFLPTNYPKYEIIKATKESLAELVYYLNIANREDSLQTLALMDEDERNKILKGIIKEKKDAEAERLRKLQEERENEFNNRQNLRTDQAADRGRGGNRAGSWYFYNEGSKSIGFAEFKNKFGTRSLKDNWRRKNKGQVLDLGEDAEFAEDRDTGKAGKIPTMEELEANIPFTDEAMKTSQDTMAFALLEVGKVYKDRLEDLDNAIETFEDLNVRLPGNKYEQQAYYQLYRLFLGKEEDPSYFAPDPRSTSQFYADLITEDFPNSEYARLIEDPEYLASSEIERKEEVEAYEGTFRLYRQRNYTDVMVACLDVMNNDQGNRLLPKYYLLRAMSIAGKKDRENFIAALREIVSKFPETEEGIEAKRLLGLLDGGASVADTKKDPKSDKEDPKKDDGPKGEFAAKPEIDHYFALIVPNKSAKMNEVKESVSNFNTEYFRAKTFKVTNSFINSDAQIVLVRTFDDKDEAMGYFTAYLANDKELTGVNDQGNDAFVITSKNFAELFKTKDVDGYIEFFEANYLQ
jgi:tetratricopeptide (TPR) repeat protein